MDRFRSPDWTETTPHPERPALSQGQQPGSGTATDRILTALAGLALAGLILRAFVPA